MKEMSSLIPVLYHRKNYPFDVSPEIREVGGHFDVEVAGIESPFSLHTEHSYVRRKLSSPVLDTLPYIRTYHKNHVPQLWANRKWAADFADFIINITIWDRYLKIIEIHPPFDDYCRSLKDFIQRYRIFEDRILSVFPEVEILVENRHITTYRGGDFLLSRNEDIIRLSEMLDRERISLRIVLDTQELFSAHLESMEISEHDITSILRPLRVCSQYIRGLHVRGRRKTESGRWVSHVGNLDTYFDHDISKKHCFMRELRMICDDGSCRYFLPEVKSSDEDLKAIISDIEVAGFEFVPLAQVHP